LHTGVSGKFKSHFPGKLDQISAPSKNSC